MFDSRMHKSQKTTPLKSSRLYNSQNISPINSENYEKLNDDKKHIINKLLYVFTFYSSKISKYSYRELNEKYFLQLISDLYLIRKDKPLVRNSLEYKDFLSIYFAKGRKNSASGIKFEEFLQTLPVISIYLCPQIEQRQQSVKHLLKSVIYLYESKVAPNIEAQLVQYEEPINDQTKQMILKLKQSFSTVYKIYFPNEIAGKFNTKDHSHQSFEFLLIMMKDFDIFPKLVSASSLFYLYSETIKSTENNLLQETEYIKQKLEEKGTLFTLSRMIQFLVSCSRINFSKLKNLQNPEYDIAYQKQIFKTLLQYMQTIKSTKNSFRSSMIFKENRFSFILLQEYEDNQQSKMTRTFIVKDRIIKQTQKQMEFFSMFQKMNI